MDNQKQLEDLQAKAKVLRNRLLVANGGKNHIAINSSFRSKADNEKLSESKKTQHLPQSESQHYGTRLLPKFLLED